MALSVRACPWLQASLSLNAQTISAELRSQLDGYPPQAVHLLVPFFY